jgi:nitrous oxidase accessory protein
MILLISLMRVCSTCEYKDLYDAVNKAKAYDTVEVIGGEYTAINLTIKKPIVLIGKDSPILDGKKKDEILIVESDDVIIRGFVFKNSAFGFVKDYSALRIRGCKKGCKIEGNTFKDNMWSIYLENSRDVEVRENKIDGGKIKDAATYAGNGIHAWKCENIVIEGNEVIRHRDGIYFEFVKGSKIFGNKMIKNARYGIHLMFSDKVEIYGNILLENGAVAIMYSKYYTFSHNRVERHWGGTGYGLLLKEASFGKVSENFFYKNTVGILFEGSNNIEVEENVFLQNGYAIRYLASSSGNKIRKNDFLGNTFDLTVNNVQLNVLFEENYYDTYVGYDINRDGYGDVPHRLVSIFPIFLEISPASSILLKSPLQFILDKIEKAFPTIITSPVEDKKPRMRRWKY